jgi:ABC-type sugar transport system ATPase subunit
MATVRLQGVSKRFGDGTPALDRIDLEVGDGELLVVVGPSGCGKSTLLRIIAGLEQASEGAVFLGEQRVDDWPAQRRNVAMVFQEYALYPFYTVRDNLAFPLRMRRLPRPELERRVTQVAKLLELEPLLDRYPRELSGGQRQRVAMGRALVRNPTVSLFDEPLSNLDAKLRVSVRAEIAAIQERTRTTMLYVTHDQTEAMTLGHRVAVLDRGRLQQVAKPAEIYERPANAFVAGFIGNPPMNLFPALAEGRAEGLLLRVGTQTLLASAAALWRLPEHFSFPAPLTAGIRPEDLRLANAGEENALPASVVHVEHLGHETLLHASLESLPAVRWIARIAGMRDFAKGAQLWLQAPAARIYLFPDTAP